MNIASMALAMRLKHTYEAVGGSLQQNSGCHDDDDASDDDGVLAVQLPRKITMFRVLVERKLGIDWEHGDEQSYQEDQDQDD